MPDMLVNLLKLPEADNLCELLEKQGISIFRPIAPDKRLVVDWVNMYSTAAAASECEVCFAHTPISCFIAAKGNTILGYACYDTTAPNFFGPTRVHEDARGLGLGKALLLRCLWAQREAGYVYGIIGGVGPAEFYKKAVGAVLIEDSTPGIYKNFLSSSG